MVGKRLSWTRMGLILEYCSTIHAAEKTHLGDLVYTGVVVGNDGNRGVRLGSLVAWYAEELRIG